MPEHKPSTIHTNREILARFFSQLLISKTNTYEGVPCWDWQSKLNPGGYGRFSINAVRRHAHRASYIMFRDKNVEGLDIDHLCRNRLCVNPAHLEAVTRGVNVLRGVGCVAQHARQTICVNGHPLTPDNILASKHGRRRCKNCHRIREQACRDRKKQKANPSSPKPR